MKNIDEQVVHERIEKAISSLVENEAHDSPFRIRLPHPDADKIIDVTSAVWELTEVWDAVKSLWRSGHTPKEKAAIINQILEKYKEVFQKVVFVVKGHEKEFGNALYFMAKSYYMEGGPTKDFRNMLARQITGKTIDQLQGYEKEDDTEFEVECFVRLAKPLSQKESLDKLMKLEMELVRIIGDDIYDGAYEGDGRRMRWLFPSEEAANRADDIIHSYVKKYPEFTLDYSNIITA